MTGRHEYRFTGLAVAAKFKQEIAWGAPYAHAVPVSVVAGSVKEAERKAIGLLGAPPRHDVWRFRWTDCARA